MQLSKNWSKPILLLVKRIVDVVGSGLLLLILAPLFFVVAVLIKLTSTGPVFYRWKVVGQDGSPFVSYKFRSMCVNADAMKKELELLNEMTGPVFKMTKDPRITRVGHWLRRYSIDELPQLYSVFKGQMSLVGPRPPLQSEYAQFTAKQRQKLSVKPGMTCLWQVEGRNQVKDFEEWLRLDLTYIASWSLWLDCKILLRTAVAVFAGSGK